MKKMLFPFLALAGVFLLASCSEKFKVAAPYKNITVIYGFLDKKDTAHYIRIQKAFLDDNKNALDMAKVADSSFYQNLNVVIKRIDYLNTGNLHDTIHLNRVDLTNEGYPKGTGVFFNTPNYAYKFTNVLDNQYLYRIVVTNFATGEVDSAETPVIEDIDSTVFTVSKLDHVFERNIDFSRTAGNAVVEFQAGYNAPGTFSYNNNTSPATIAQAILRFNWVDSNLTTHVLTPQYYDFNLGYSAVGNGSVDYKITDNNLYNVLLSALGTAPDYTERLLSPCTFTLYLSTPDYNTYQQVIAAQGTGLTGDDIEPNYTNAKGKNVLGLFTARGFRTGTLALTDPTVDSIIHMSTFQKAHVVGTSY